VMRVIASTIPSLAQLRLPASLAEIASLHNGIVLVTGPTGSGKSTTLAAIVDLINDTRAIHIVTIEDPIEYLHAHKVATIHQRELHSDTPTFALALRAALRQAPKVILVGEMRDRETIEIAMTAAETGHLVFSTLHTIDASKTVERIVGTFDATDQQAIRTRLAASFRYFISQRFVPLKEGGRMAILEVLKSTMRTREYIEIVRTILRREEPLEHHGEHYDIPYAGPGATGLGKPLKIIVHPLRSEVPIYLAAIGPKNVALTAEIADGWLPLFFSPFRSDVYKEPLRNAKPDFDVACTVTVNVDDDLEQALLPTKWALAFYIGGMGARGKNFYYDYCKRLGFEDAAVKIQDLFLSGNKDGAMAAVPEELIDACHLVGPAERIRERAQRWKAAAKNGQVGSMLIGTQSPQVLDLLADALL